MSALLILLACSSAILFPWQLTIFLTLIAAVREPLSPLLVGLFMDLLYFSGGTFSLPRMTLLGAFATLSLLLVRSRLRSSIMVR
ncbi:MAG: hypothetical protein AAB442_02175 [Patescibacteria group bacterium]